MDGDNALRFVPHDARGHVESYFIKAASPDGRRALWIKHTVLSPLAHPDRAVAEVWAIAFDHDDSAGFPLGVKTTVPFAQARWLADPFRFETPAAAIESGRARGEAAREGRRIAWALELAPEGPAYHPFPYEWMYRGPFPKSKTLTPIPDALVAGHADVNGARWDLEGWRGMQGHNWGHGHAHTYVWAHANAWTDPRGTSAWFEGLAARVEVGPFLTPFLALGAVHVDGRIYRFDRPSSLLRARTDVTFDRWQFAFAQAGCQLEGEIVADRAQTAGLRYENPNEVMTYCLNSKLARGRLHLVRAQEPPLELTTDRFALEIGTRDARHGVHMIL